MEYDHLINKVLQSEEISSGENVALALQMLDGLDRACHDPERDIKSALQPFIADLFKINNGLEGSDELIAAIAKNAVSYSMCMIPMWNGEKLGSAIARSQLWPQAQRFRWDVLSDAIRLDTRLIVSS